jgi:acyl carrier protein
MLMPALFLKNLKINKMSIIEKLKEIINPYTDCKEELENINEDTDFLIDLKINSANLVDIVLDIEEKFGITIDDASMTKMLTVKATIAIIEEKQAENAG